MDLSGPDHSPTQSDLDRYGLARSIFVARGILWRSITMLVANEPKPWSPRLREIRETMAQAHGILADAWEYFDDATKDSAIRKAQDEVAQRRTRRSSRPHK